MDKKTKIIIGGSVLLLGGIGTFFFIRQRKKKKALAMSSMVNPMLNSSSSVSSTNYVNTNSSTSKPSGNQVVLEKGSKGENVSKLQQLLNKIGGTALKVDGIFGSKTKAALEKITGSSVVTPSLMMNLAKKAMSSFFNRG